LATAQKDGTVPFWVYEGNAIASEEMVRITPSLRSKKGSIWTRDVTTFNHWEVELWFRVTGRGRLGADGLAFFFTESKLEEGPVFGSADNFKGLAVFFDSFDNDAKGNNPYIMAMTNDGTKSYNHDNDGADQQLGGCVREFRNTPYPVRAKLEYYQNVLTVLFHSGHTNTDDEYELCMRVENVVLPANGFFGVSAATGGLADDHDVLKFLTSSLQDPTQIKDKIEEDRERERYTREYEEYQTKLEKQKTDYLKLHPDEVEKLKMDPSDEYESVGEREFKQVLHAQNEIHDVMKGFAHKLDEILGRQERSLSLLSLIQSTGYAQQTGGAAQPVAQPSHPVSLPMQRHEFESLFAQTQEVVSNTRQLKQSVLTMANAGAQQPQPASVQQASQYNQQLLQESRDGVNTLRQELSRVMTIVQAQHTPQPLQQPQCPTCLSSTTFFVTILLHLAALIGFLFWKSSQESQSKKFY
jgi:mannose-binding lectin 1